MTKLFSLKTYHWNTEAFEVFHNMNVSYVGPDCFVVHDVFLSVFWWIYCYNIGWAKVQVPV